MHCFSGLLSGIPPPPPHRLPFHNPKTFQHSQRSCSQDAEDCSSTDFSDGLESKGSRGM